MEWSKLLGIPAAVVNRHCTFVHYRRASTESSSEVPDCSAAASSSQSCHSGGTGGGSHVAVHRIDLRTVGAVEQLSDRLAEVGDSPLLRCSRDSSRMI